jgi:hypothetical protein
MVPGAVVKVNASFVSKITFSSAVKNTTLIESGVTTYQGFLNSPS